MRAPHRGKFYEGTGERPGRLPGSVEEIADLFIDAFPYRAGFKSWEALLEAMEGRYGKELARVNWDAAERLAESWGEGMYEDALLTVLTDGPPPPPAEPLEEEEQPHETAWREIQEGWRSIGQ